MSVARRGFLGGALALASAGVATPAQARPADPVASLWSGMALQGADGRTFGVRDLPASATLIHLWAHWCPACLGELASLSETAAALGGKVDVVLVSHPQFWQADQAFAARRNLPFRFATPSGANAPGTVETALLENGAYVVPRTVLLGADGRDTVWSHMGAVAWSAPATAARLRAAIG